MKYRFKNFKQITLKMFNKLNMFLKNINKLNKKFKIKKNI